LSRTIFLFDTALGILYQVIQSAITYKIDVLANYFIDL